MRLTLHTDYAFRALMFLCSNKERLSTIAEIAKFYNISRNHLVKVINTLVKGNFIEAIRGKGGGLRLANNSEKISLGKIIRITEPDFILVECFSSNNSCILTPICQLKHILSQAINNFLKDLDGFSLSDLSLDKDRILLLEQPGILNDSNRTKKIFQLNQKNPVTDKKSSH